jgi:dTMP kinase
MNKGGPVPSRCLRGPLVSVEGISGAGKTFLTKLATAQLVAAGHQVTSISDFSARSAATGPDLGREFLHALIGAAGGDRFRRGGHLHAETLLLLAIKTYDYEAAMHAASPGQIIIDGRSLDTTAVYQSVLMHSGDDQAALEEARRILHLAGQWRPLADLTILISGDTELALDRARQRDQRPFTPEERLIELRASRIYAQLAAEDPARIRVLDPDGLAPEAAATVMADLITSVLPSLDCQVYPGTSCVHACRFTSASTRHQRPARL